MGDGRGGAGEEGGSRFGGGREGSVLRADPLPEPERIHRFEHFVVGALGLGARILPEPVALFLGGVLGWMAGTVVRLRRRVVDENLKRAFPLQSAGWRAAVARGSYFHLGREAVTLLRFGAMGVREVRERTRTEGFETVRSLLERGEGLIMVSGHFGNWEIGGAAVAVRNIPLDVVAVRQTNPLFDRRVVRTRERLGMRVIEKKRAPAEVLRTLRRGGAVALVADQNVRRGGIFVDFFGVPASTARGPALFALRTGAPIVVAFAFRLPGARARYRLRFEPLEIERTGEQEVDAGRLTRAFLQALEEAIREAPEQYFWLHRRWKTRPDPPAHESPARGIPQEPR